MSARACVCNVWLWTCSLGPTVNLCATVCVDVYLYLACMYVHVCVSYLPECKLQYNCFESIIEVCDLGSKCAHFTEWP